MFVLRSRNCTKEENEAEPEEEIQEKVETSVFLKWMYLQQHWILRTILETSLFFIFSVTVLYLWPSKFTPVAYRFPDSPPLTGALQPNSELAKAKQGFKGELNGPEAIVSHEGVLYTGSADGKVLSIHNGEILVLAQFGPKNPCATKYYEEICGRPLGMAVSPFNGHLWVIDAIFGLYSVNMTTGEFKRKVSADQLIAGRYSKFFNDVSISPVNGRVYISDTSTKWRRTDFFVLGLETNPDGRILEYNPATGDLIEVCTGVSPNGIQITSDGSAILISDTSFATISKCQLIGKTRGKVEVVMKNMPGFPDNIRASPRGTHWVALTAVRQPTILIELVSPCPFLKEMIYKLSMIWKSELVRPVRDMIPKGSKPMNKKYGLIIEINEKGHVIRSLHDNSGKISSISHVQESEDGVLYLGSATNDYIGILQLS
ncbi:hypothetical protein CAPTEDRAFT_198473 [Capitella teleta]|uniref:Strictosidine synthase conserved region domain-containing protein n=1 Tax=Capitella teleta TaxID=283909 RepID=R7TTB4_CAPTE|nr:hypothetical protein CAPTEDRAFT_198473 [Capitella teleta]|eukprot:ELT94726.1 hypothetical protein CAPTEDRAFT_198473 [Capitella teleta]